MKQLSQTQHAILTILGDGLCHSGNELGEQLGISRSAIWKQINQLLDLGLPISRLAQQGYQLKQELILLQVQKINAELSAKTFNLPYSLHLFTAIDSTNTYLKHLTIDKPLLAICCAEVQTQGKGRFGRHWHSPFGENIYLSTRWDFHCDLSKLAGLSLITSLAVLACIRELNPQPEILVKWPNDLVWNHKKLCGTLIEISAESNANAQVIIGIGLNVNSDTKDHPLPDKEWCSLFEIFGHTFNRNTLIASLIVHLHRYIELFLNHGLEYFMDEWRAHDYLAGKTISVQQSVTSVTGLAKGISALGQLIVADESGLEHYLASGDASVKLDL